MRRFLLAMTQAAWLLPLSAQAQNCEAIRFPPGAHGTEITGIAPADGVLCYTLGTGANQSATIRVLEGRNTVFSILDVVDAQTEYRFQTQAREYRILVTQLMRAALGEPFRLSVQVTGQQAATAPAPVTSSAWRGVEAGIMGRMSATAADGATRITLSCRSGGPRAATLQLTDYPGGLLPRGDGQAAPVQLDIEVGGSRRSGAVTMMRHDGNDQWWDAVDAIGTDLLDAIAAGRTLRLLDANGGEIALFGLSGSSNARRAIRNQCGF